MGKKGNERHTVFCRCTFHVDFNVCVHCLCLLSVLYYMSVFYVCLHEHVPVVHYVALMCGRGRETVTETVTETDTKEHPFSGALDGSIALVVSWAMHNTIHSTPECNHLWFVGLTICYLQLL
jgi:hypothetical protein